MRELIRDISLIVLGGVISIGLVYGLLIGGSALYKTYNVWGSEMDGKAKLMEATQSRQILVEQAKAELEASELRAKAIAIVGQATKDFPEYRQQEFIGAFAEALQHGDIQQIIYVPTEASIPIIEARNK